MAEINARGRSPQRDIIRFDIKRIRLKLFMPVLLLLCSWQVAVADFQTKMLFKSTSQIVAVRFTPSGSVISASRDGTVTLWDANSDRPVWVINFQRPPRMNDFTQVQIYDMDLSPDGRLAAVAYIHSGVDLNLADEKAGDILRQKTGVHKPHIVLIDTADGTIKKDFQEFGVITFGHLFLSPTGKSVFITTSILGRPKDDQTPISTTHVLSLDTGLEVQSFSSQYRIWGAALSPDGKLLAVTTFRYTDRYLEVFDAAAGRLLRRSQVETIRPVALGFSSDGRLLAMCRSAKDGLRVDLLPTEGAEKPVRSISVSGSTEVRAIAFIAEPHQIALAGGSLPIVDTDDVGTPLYKDNGGAVIVIDERTGKKLKSLQFKSFVTSLAISQDKSRMAVGMYDGQIAITTFQ